MFSLKNTLNSVSLLRSVSILQEAVSKGGKRSFYRDNAVIFLYFARHFFSVLLDKAIEYFARAIYARCTIHRCTITPRGILLSRFLEPRVKASFAWSDRAKDTCIVLRVEERICRRITKRRLTFRMTVTRRTRNLFCNKLVNTFLTSKFILDALQKRTSRDINREESIGSVNRRKKETNRASTDWQPRKSDTDTNRFGLTNLFLADVQGRGERKLIQGFDVKPIRGLVIWPASRPHQPNRSDLIF